MRKLLSIAALAALCVAPCATLAQSTAMASSVATIGVGPHGYDWLVGTWSCTNSMPGPMSGPAQLTLTATRSNVGAISFHSTGTNFDAIGYVAYAAKTKTWWNPSSNSTGGYGTESSTQTGKKTTWTGPYTDASGKSVQQRDMYTWTNANTFNDVFAVDMGGTWKTEGNTTCTKT